MCARCTALVRAGPTLSNRWWCPSRPTDTKYTRVSRASRGFKSMRIARPWRPTVNEGLPTSQDVDRLGSGNFGSTTARSMRIMCESMVDRPDGTRCVRVDRGKFRTHVDPSLAHHVRPSACLAEPGTRSLACLELDSGMGRLTSSHVHYELESDQLRLELESACCAEGFTRRSPRIARRTPTCIARPSVVNDQ